MNQINTDIQHYIQTMPDYREPLDFLQIILNFQNNLAEKIEVDFQFQRDTVRRKWQEGYPLLAGEKPPVSKTLFKEALANLHLLLHPEETARAALDGLLNSPLTIEALLSKPISGCETQILKIAKDAAADLNDLTYLLQVVLSPFYQKKALPFQGLIEEVNWRRGICPICGSEPGIARLSASNGRRMLICSLCHSEWSFDRLRCPFCAGRNRPQDNNGRGKPRLRCFTTDNAKTRRVDCCDQCHRYLKTVDERVSTFPINLPAEDIVTTYLDVLAHKQGYR